MSLCALNYINVQEVTVDTVWKNRKALPAILLVTKLDGGAKNETKLSSSHRVFLQ